MARHIEQVKSTDADVANRRMDRLRNLLNHPGVLAADPSASGVLAFAPAITVRDSPAHLDRNVGARGRDHGSLARRLAL
jgi:hypothetical protein